MDNAPTIPVSSRVDVQSLADLARFFFLRGVTPTSQSQLLSMAVEVIVKQLRDSGELPYSERFKTLESAYEYLTTVGLVGKGRRVSKSFAKALQIEALNKEGKLDYIPPSHKIKAEQFKPPAEQVDPGELKKAMQLLEERKRQEDRDSCAFKEEMDNVVKGGQVK